VKIKTNYNEIASTYDERYEVNYLTAVEQSLLSIASENNVYKILEAGCGTGRWLKSLHKLNIKLFGLDYSIQMLKIAKDANNIEGLVNADASNFPFKSNSFDLIFCINAIHHFPDKKKFFFEAHRCLNSNGILCIYGVDPYIDKNWYVYDYFDGVYKKDLMRFPSLNEIKNYCLMFDLQIEEQILVERVYNSRTGNEVFSDPFLKKNMNSQLANLTEEEYNIGIEKIKQKINYQPDKKFITEINFYLTKARKGI
jgi:ubiquinone/menaquinone biosynthesis C-methylase UbiE